MKLKPKSRINENPHILHFVFKRNRNFPNSKLPVIIYQGALNLPRQKNKAAEIARSVCEGNGWSNTWKNGIYDFHHYHSITHECMAVVMGSARLVLGGPGGKAVELNSGDVIILPAGIGHACTRASDDFLCIGSYPQGKDYDTNYGIPAEFKIAVKRIKELSIPAGDPIFGKTGFLKVYWKK